MDDGISRLRLTLNNTALHFVKSNQFYILRTTKDKYNFAAKMLLYTDNVN